VTEEELIDFIAGLSGVVIETASEGTGAPEIAWGDSFVYYDPDGDTPPARRFPFVTIVTKDYPGFDESSQLNRDGAFRLNISVGKQRFTDLIGYPPSQHAEHKHDPDYSLLDTVMPHPEYGQQAWVSIVNPGPRTSDHARALISEARERMAIR
jgi:hypothetical protein